MKLDWEEFVRETRAAMRAEVAARELAKSLTPEQRLAGLTLEQRLIGLTWRQLRELTKAIRRERVERIRKRRLARQSRS